jgi:hypothetical protein
MVSRVGTFAKYTGALVGCLLIASTAHAVSMLDFDSPGGGTISYAGGVSPLVGTNISVDLVSAIPGGPFGVACSNCFLNFQTGNLVAGDASQYTFASGGSITITGLVAGMSGGSVTLLSGSFDGVTTVNGFGIAGDSFSDFKNPALLALFGLPAGPYAGNLNLMFTAILTSSPTVFASVPDGGDVVNNSTVPEPGTLLLLSSGLGGLRYLVRRRRVAG